MRGSQGYVNLISHERRRIIESLVLGWSFEHSDRQVHFPAETAQHPAGCHRRHLLGPALRNEELDLLHIRAGGQVQSENDLETLENPVEEAQQLSLFDSGSDGGI